MQTGRRQISSVYGIGYIRSGHSKTPSQQRHEAALTHGSSPRDGNAGIFNNINVEGLQGSLQAGLQISEITFTQCVTALDEAFLPSFLPMSGCQVHGIMHRCIMQVLVQFELVQEPCKDRQATVTARVAPDFPGNLASPGLGLVKLQQDPGAWTFAWHIAGPHVQPENCRHRAAKAWLHTCIHGDM